MAAATTGSEAYPPLIRQYLDIKSRHPDSLLFFRVGDFYEMFFEDAEEGSGLLGLTLTARNNGGKRDIPLAGVPVKAVDEYVARLLEMGRRVAICEQLEDPAEARGIVRRDVVEIITPGTVLEDKLLAARRNNYVVAIAGDAPFGLATVDLSTGEFELREVAAADLSDELGRIEPAEIVILGGGVEVGLLRERGVEGAAVVHDHHDEGLAFQPHDKLDTVRFLVVITVADGVGQDLVDGEIDRVGDLRRECVGLAE